MIVLSFLLALAPVQPLTPVNPYAGPHVEKTYTFKVTAPGKLTVTTLNGRISVKAGDTGSIIVVANRRSASQDALGKLSESVMQQGQDVTATGMFPSDCGETCGSVDFTITVPPNTSVTANGTNGSIGIEDIDGTVVAATKNGPVLCGGLGGDVTLGSENGMVNAGFRDLSHVSKAILGTNNGVVRVVLPHGATIGTIKAGTKNGKILTPWALTPVKQSDGAMKVDHQFSKTGPLFLLGTSTGDVDVVISP